MDSPSHSSSLDLQRYRTYLLLLARSHDKMSGEEESDLVQKTMLAAHAQRAEFCGQSPAELAAWLKQILRREVIDAYRHRRRLKSDVHPEVPLGVQVDGSFSRAQVCLAAVQTSPSQHVSRRKSWLGRRARPASGRSQGSSGAAPLAGSHPGGSRRPVTAYGSGSRRSVASGTKTPAATFGSAKQPVRANSI